VALYEYELSSESEDESSEDEVEEEDDVEDSTSITSSLPSLRLSSLCLLFLLPIILRIIFNKLIKF
jgi:hypothetical protein